MIGTWSLNGHFLQKGVSHVGKFKQGDIGSYTKTFFKNRNKEQCKYSGKCGRDECTEKLFSQDDQAGLVKNGNDTGEENVYACNPETGFIQTSAAVNVSCCSGRCDRGKDPENKDTEGLVEVDCGCKAAPEAKCERSSSVD